MALAEGLWHSLYAMSAFVESNRKSSWQRIGDIPDFPFRNFTDLSIALNEERWGLGIDSFAASYWASRNDVWWKRTLVKALSLTLVAVAMLTVIGALDLKEYWAIAGVPAMAITFYLAHPSLPGRQILTAAGVGMFVGFIAGLVYGYPRPAIVLGLCALTFLFVRLASLISVTSFRKAITTDEKTFLEMYSQGGVTLRDNSSGKVFINR
jgi:hypothetical protein